MQQEITIVAEKIFLLAQALNVTNINQLPGAWIHDIDKAWRIAVNGQDHKIEIPGTADRMGVELEPFHIAVWYNGWLAGIMSPFDGIIAAGEGANEDTLIAALDVAIKAAQ